MRAQTALPARDCAARGAEQTQLLIRVRRTHGGTAHACDPARARFAERQHLVAGSDALARVGVGAEAAQAEQAVGAAAGGLRRTTGRLSIN